VKQEYLIAVLVDRMDEFEKWKRNISLQVDTFQSSAYQQDKYTNVSDEIKYVPVIDVHKYRGYRFDGLLTLSTNTNKDKLNYILSSIQ